MKRPSEETLDKYLAGLLPDDEAQTVEQYLADSDELLREVDPSNRVGDFLRKHDPSAGLFEDVDLTERINRQIHKTSIKPRVSFKQLVAASASIAAALLIAFLAVLFISARSSDFVQIMPNIAKSMSISYCRPGSDQWTALEETSVLEPGCRISADGATGLIEIADGSTFSLRNGSELVLGGSEEYNFSFALLKGEFRAYIKGSSLYTISTNPTSFQCREGQFVLYADDPILRPPRFIDACASIARSGKMKAILAVSQGLVETDKDKYDEGSRRDWSFQEAPSADFASLEAKYCK